MKSFLSALIFLFILNFNNTHSQDLETKTIITGLDTPWEILWGPDNWIWMTERGGIVSRVNPNTGEKIELIKIHEVFENGERGLMGMVLHPDFTTNPYVYVVYNTGTTDANTKIQIMRYTYVGVSLTSANYILGDIGGWWNHDGARLWIDSDKTLYVTIGDAAQGNLAQNKLSQNGKLLRMTLDGGAPMDNPFVGVPGYDPYIYSLGHRNAQGLVFANGKIYSSEHGASTNDELNIIEKARNYGWPQVEGYCTTDSEKSFCLANNVAEPIAVFYENSTAAVCGIDYYNSDYISEWKNSILMTALKGRTLFQVKLSEDGKSVVESKPFFANQFGRLRDVCISPDGRVFIATSNRDGRGTPINEDDRIIEVKVKGTSVEPKKKDEIRIFPNPANENLVIELSENEIAEKIEIFNLLGDIVFSSSINSNSYIWDLKSSEGSKVTKAQYILKMGNLIKLINID